MPSVTTNGVETHYERTGSGPPVVFIHGLGWDRRSWRPQLAALADEYDLVAYDYRDHGESEGAPGTAYSIGLLAEDLHALVEALSLDSPVLCAHSYGGLIAAEYAVRYPDDVAGIAFADARTAIGESAFERAMFRLQPVLARLESVVGRERYDRFMEFVAERVADAEQGSDEEVPELGCTPSEYAEAVTDGMSLDVEGKFVTAGREYVGASPTDFHVPVLYAYGELTSDVIAGKADRLDRAPTDVRVREVANAGHGLMLEQPEAFTAVLESFLRDVTGDGSPRAAADGD
ncbi:alpha/beta fold hydrolase [Halostella litorea]|uniref:alpha/beta fold hydrolase n=1 Tax=Halostella litorea TaxID=2528831 RepID=UPI0010925D8B|nr:alpha/beta hydrolase [Halostella litorea]